MHPGTVAVAVTEQGAQRRADGRLADVGPGVGAVDRDEHAAGLVAGADGAEPARAVPRDQGQVGQRLRVLHQGRRAAQAALAHPRRLERGQRGAAAEPVHHRGLLAGQEPRRGLGDRHAEPVQAAGGPFGQRAQDLRAGRVVQVQVRLGGADRLGGQLQAVQHEVGREPQQHLVLAAGRLALRAVGHDHLAALRRGPARATRASFRCTGKAAPPRPVRPDASMSAMSRFACPRYGTGPYLARWARRSSGAAGSRRGSPAACRAAPPGAD